MASCFLSNIYFKPSIGILNTTSKSFQIFKAFWESSLKCVFSLNSFMFSSSIRIIGPFRSAIVWVPFSPRIGAYVVMTALISLIFFVNPLFSLSAFCNFSTIFSLNFIHFYSPFQLLVFLSCLGEKILQISKKKIMSNVTIFTFICSPSAVTCSFNSFLFELKFFYLSFGFSSR